MFFLNQQDQEKVEHYFAKLQTDELELFYINFKLMLVRNFFLNFDFDFATHYFDYYPIRILNFLNIFAVSHLLCIGLHQSNQLYIIQL